MNTVSKLAGQVILDEKERSSNAIALFRPTEQQEQFVRQFAKDGGLEYLVGGGNRCLAGCQEIYDPKAKVFRRVDQIDSDFHVWSVNPYSGKSEIKKASRPFVKAYGELWRVSMSNGEIIHVTQNHRVVSHSGSWVSIRDAWQQKIPLASVQPCESSCRKDTTKVCSSGSREHPPSVELSSSTSSNEECRRPGIRSSFSGSSPLPPGPSLRDSVRGTSMLSTQSRASSRSLEENGVSAVRGVVRQKAFFHSVETPISFEWVSPDDSVLAEQQRVKSREISRCCERTSSGRHTKRASRVRQATQSVLSDGCALGCSQTIRDSKCRCLSDSHRCGGRPLLEEGSDRCAAPSRSDVLECIHSDMRMDDRASRSFGIHLAFETRLSSSPYAWIYPAIQRRDEEGRVPFSSDQQHAHSLRKGCTSQRSEDSGQSTSLENLLESALFSACHPRFFNVSKSAIATIVDVESIGFGPIWDISVERWSNYQTGATGTSGNVIHANSGKTVLVSCCIAAMCLNQPITLRDGTKIHMRPERWRKEPILVWLIGYDHKHCGTVLFKALFKSGLFRLIRDQKTGRWRSWDPTNPDDKDLHAITRPSPPLIRMSDVMDGMKGISWENKKENQISSCQMAHDGTKLQFYASTGARPQGSAVHVIWMDERLDSDQWYPELLMRLPDHRGKLVWTSWPDTHPSAALSELEKRASDQLGNTDATAFAFKLKGSDNPYTASSHRDAILATMDEDTRKARDEGSLNMDRWRVYSRFSRFVHRTHGNDHEQDDALAKEIRKANGIPKDWTRYLIFDPGTANPAALFVAVPPPKLGDYVVPYDELYPHYADAGQIAKLIRAKSEGQFFEDFIADAHACRQTPMGFSGTVGANYEKYFALEKLRCRRHGSHFSYGSDEIMPRIMKTQGAMNIRPDGTTKLRILGCPMLCGQLEVYKWAADPKGNPIDVPYKYQKIDIAQCLEYFMSRDDCRYVKPPNSTEEDKRSAKSVSAAINQFFGTTSKKKDASVYCGPGVPG